jgi:hypothetical protein
MPIAPSTPASAAQSTNDVAGRGSPRIATIAPITMRPSGVVIAITVDSEGAGS